MVWIGIRMTWNEGGAGSEADEGEEVIEVVSVDCEEDGTVTLWEWARIGRKRRSNVEIRILKVGSLVWKARGVIVYLRE
jgi:hypothetical protein